MTLVSRVDVVTRLTMFVSGVRASEYDRDRTNVKVNAVDSLPGVSMRDNLGVEVFWVGCEDHGTRMVYVGVATDGIYVSTDGQNWSQVGMGPLNIHKILMSATDGALDAELLEFGTNKIDAIKRLRTVRNLSLKDAKQYVDELWARQPKKEK